MTDALKEFVSSHPEFFKKVEGCYVLSPDIHELIEQYARLVDSDEYERIRKMVETIRKDDHEQIESQIQENKEAVKHYKAQLAEITTNLELYDDELVEIERKIALLGAEVAELTRAYKPWYASSLVFWILAATGVGCMYVGVFIRVSGASSFLPLGLILIIVGVILQSRQESTQRGGGHRAQSIQFESDQLKSQVQLLKVRRATSIQQKSIAKSALEKLYMEIRRSEQKNRILNG